MQKKLKNQKTNDEKINEIMLRGIDEQIEHFIHQKESLQRNIKEFDMQIEQLNYQRKRIIKYEWKNTLK